jgi:hypothetical protein
MRVVRIVPWWAWVGALGILFVSFIAVRAERRKQAEAANIGPRAPRVSHPESAQPTPNAPKLRATPATSMAAAMNAPEGSCSIPMSAETFTAACHAAVKKRFTGQSLRFEPTLTAQPIAVHPVLKAPERCYQMWPSFAFVGPSGERHRFSCNTIFGDIELAVW